ncbi:MAG TPA: hypothetical protein PLE36_13055, partial [Deltaproteobacteria bacterium]|nr:hypothetical protein [Deltaproteobacteria bacterium]
EGRTGEKPEDRVQAHPIRADPISRPCLHRGADRVRREEFKVFDGQTSWRIRIHNSYGVIASTHDVPDKEMEYA